VLDALAVREEMKATINAERVVHSIIELYSSTRREVVSFLRENRLEECGSLTMMADFWTCKMTHDKFLGLRVYMIDNKWEFTSILLGTRLFNPSFGDRDGGISGPFRAWLEQILEDFELDQSHFFGASSDCGYDMKAMLSTRLRLQWEWCTAHLVHAATKAACADGDDNATEGVSRLLSDVKKTIYQVNVVEKVGDLFECLCKSHTAGKSVRLLGYNPARFLSMATSIRRILDKWPALEEWYRARAAKAARERKRPPVFLLADDRDSLEQLLSLITPITSVKRVCQAEQCNQVEAILALYMARMNTLEPNQPMKHYLSTRDEPKWIQPNFFTQITIDVQRRLREGLCNGTVPVTAPLLRKLGLLKGGPAPSRSRSTSATRCRKQTECTEGGILMEPSIIDTPGNPEGYLS
jgi:hypothetical protein